MASWTELAFFWARTFRNEVFPIQSTFDTDEVDLSGQIWIVTGASDGIGKELAAKLVQRNAKVWILGRNLAKLESTVEYLSELTTNAHVDFILADLADLSTIKPGMAKFLAAETRLDGIIHNAGIFNDGEVFETKQHLDITIGVNNVGPQLVQKLVDPLILANPRATIVWTSSTAHALAPPGGFDLTDLETLRRSSFWRYSESKALALAQAVQWSNHHPNAKVRSVAVHPGFIATNLGNIQGTAIERYLLRFLRWPAEFGARAGLYAALAPDIPPNAYIIPWGAVGAIRPDVEHNIRGANGRSAWEWLEKQISPYV